MGNAFSRRPIHRHRDPLPEDAETKKRSGCNRSAHPEDEEDGEWYYYPPYVQCLEYRVGSNYAHIKALERDLAAYKLKFNCLSLDASAYEELDKEEAEYKRRVSAVDRLNAAGFSGSIMPDVQKLARRSSAAYIKPQSDLAGDNKK